MVDIGRHVGVSARQGTAKWGQLLQPGANFDAQGVNDCGDGLSAAPINVGIVGDYPLLDASRHGVAAVGERWSTAIVGGCSAYAARGFNHYPLSVQAAGGQELGVRVEFDTDVFDAVSVGALGRWGVGRAVAAGVGGDDR
jgi:hypothetical protein